MIPIFEIMPQALEDDIQSPAELPYFEGDFWPNVMEDNIRELEEEEEARRRVTTYLKYKSCYFCGCKQGNTTSHSQW